MAEKRTRNHDTSLLGLKHEKGMSNTQQQYQRKAIIEQDKLNRITSFDLHKQLYPADLFILIGFDFKGRPILERNPRWHTKDGFYSGRSA
jgi:hypothetical protein